MRRNLAQVAQTAPLDPILQDTQRGIPTIVYFTTPGCVPCKTQQQPALARLKANSDQPIQIIQIDAAEQPEVAQRWGVMTAPTTFVLDAQGKPRAVNYGVADEHKLRQQLLSA
jgi:thioredoxin-like negative regulator of GroEL